MPKIIKNIMSSWGAGGLDLCCNKNGKLTRSQWVGSGISGAEAAKDDSVTLNRAAWGPRHDAGGLRPATLPNIF